MRPEDTMVVFDKSAYVIYSVHADNEMAHKQLMKLKAEGHHNYGVFSLTDAINWILFKQLACEC